MGWMAILLPAGTWVLNQAAAWARGSSRVKYTSYRTDTKAAGSNATRVKAAAVSPATLGSRRLRLGQSLGSRMAAFLAIQTMTAAAASARNGDRKSIRLNSSHGSISYAV